MLPATPAVWMVAPAPEEGCGEGEATPFLSEESDSGKSYEATQEDATISQGNVEIAVRVAQALETFTGRCFRCNKVGHRVCDEECEIEVGRKEEVWAHKAHALPFPRDHPNPSPTDLLARKKHDAVPP